MSEINLFNRWTVKKRSFWLLIAGASFLVVALLCVSSIFFSIVPIMGGSNNSIAYDTDEYYEESYSMPMEAPAANGVFYDMDDNVREMAIVEPEADYKRVDQSASALPQSAQTERIIIKEGNISIEVEDTRASREDIEGIVAALANQGAFIINSFETQNYSGEVPYISMVIRVPFEDFDRVMDAVANMGVEINDRNEFADDVTAEYVDLESRIEAIEAARDRLLEIMKNADTTEDLLFAEQKLTERETELASLKGRLKYLSESALLSRISISLSPYIFSQPINYDWKPANTLRNAFVDLVDSLKNFADFIIIFSVLVLPWLLLSGFILWLVVRFIKRRATKKIVKKTDS